MAEIIDEDVRSSAEHALDQKVDVVELVVYSSNFVYRVDTASGECFSLRIPRLRPPGLSPFWQHMQDVFGLEYGRQLLSVDPLVHAIRDDGLIRTPHLIASTTVGDRPAYVFTWVEGMSWEPDEFPDNGPVHEQLGRYLAHLHLRRYERFGTLTSQERDPAGFVARVNASMQTTIERRWTHRPDVANWFACHAESMNPRVFEGHLSPIMPDLSGNQFVFGDDAIVGLVDLDSYVVGPRELELSIAELCITRPEDFRRGYEDVLPLPRFADFRAYCRFWTMLADPADDPDLETFLTDHAYFD